MKTERQIRKNGCLESECEWEEGADAHTTHTTDKICKIMFASNNIGLWRMKCNSTQRSNHYKSGHSMKMKPLQRNEMPNKNNHWWQMKRRKQKKLNQSEREKQKQYIAQHSSVIISIFPT